MPLMPGPVAIAVYTGVKLASYAGFAGLLNRSLDTRKNVWAFAALKTLLGFAGGAILLLGSRLPAMEWMIRPPGYDVCHLLLRLGAWTAALCYVYPLRARPGLLTAAVLAGTLLSYGVDAALSAAYGHFKLVPGFSIAIC